VIIQIHYESIPSIQVASVLSEDSLASNWVAYEVEKAINKEPEGIPNAISLSVWDEHI